ncbi:MAG: hypothetical protein J0L97_05490 [Alphaproteobacteria bacterium]|nr:hypothetical protein [Alphaproteobacteria bacterium]
MAITLALVKKLHLSLEQPQTKFRDAELEALRDVQSVLFYHDAVSVTSQLMRHLQLPLAELEEVFINCCYFGALNTARMLREQYSVTLDEYSYLSSLRQATRSGNVMLTDFLIANAPPEIGEATARKAALAYAHSSYAFPCFNHIIAQGGIEITAEDLERAKDGPSIHSIQSIMLMLEEMEENTRSTKSLWNEIYGGLAEIHRRNPDLQPSDRFQRHNMDLPADTPPPTDAEREFDRIYTLLRLREFLLKPHIFFDPSFARGEMRLAYEEQATKLWKFFGTVQAAFSYIERWFDQTDPQAIHDACLFDLPDDDQVWDVAVWRALAMKIGRKGLSYLGLAVEIEEVLRKEGAWPVSPQALNPPAFLQSITDNLIKLDYPRAGENPEFAMFCLEHGVSAKVFDECLDILKRLKDSPVESKCPQLTIDGATLGPDFAGYEFVTIDKTDFRGLLLGKIVNCCQSIGSAGARCALHGMESPYGQHYVIQRKAKGTHPAEIVAASWGWIGEGKSFTFDSFERLSADYNPLFLPFYQEAAKQITQHGFSRVTVGSAGSHFIRGLELNPADPPAKPVDHDGYPDSSTQMVLAEKLRRRGKPDEAMRERL